MRNSGFQFVQRELQKNPEERKIFEQLVEKSPNTISLKMLETDHRLSIIYMAFYYKFSAYGKVHPTDREAAAGIWKRYYNTKLGTGTTQRFLSAYARQHKHIERYREEKENILIGGEEVSSDDSSLEEYEDRFSINNIDKIK